MPLVLYSYADKMCHGGCHAARVVEETSMSDETKKVFVGRVNGEAVFSEVSKVEFHKWTVADKPGRYRQISKTDLRVDPEYQRDNVNEGRVLDIAKNWSWVALNAIAVAEREDGTLWVMDGQHRFLAALKRSDIIKLPCLVFSVGDRKSEAKSFRMLNTNRGPVSTYHKFRAQLIEQEPSALAIRAMVEESGYHITKGGAHNRSVNCVGALQSAFNRAPDITRRVYRLCVEICNGAHLNASMFASLFDLEKKMDRSRAELGSLTDPLYKGKLIKAGPDVIVQWINKAKGYHGKGGAAVGAIGVAKMLDDGRRRKLLDGITE